jgi:hypothetical protein
MVQGFVGALGDDETALLYRAVECPASEMAYNTPAPFIFLLTIVLLVHIIQSLTTQPKWNPETLDL